MEISGFFRLLCNFYNLGFIFFRLTNEIWKTFYSVILQMRVKVVHHCIKLAKIHKIHKHGS